MKSGSVTAWEESVVIPTYEVGDPDKNPLFFEKARLPRKQRKSLSFAGNRENQ